MSRYLSAASLGLHRVIDTLYRVIQGKWKEYGSYCLGFTDVLQNRIETQMENDMETGVIIIRLYRGF